MKITLTTWATRSFEIPPSLITLRQWAKSGRIRGAVKIGRTWMCDESSVYIERPVDAEGASGLVLDNACGDPGLTELGKD